MRIVKDEEWRSYSHLEKGRCEKAMRLDSESFRSGCDAFTQANQAFRPRF